MYINSYGQSVQDSGGWLHAGNQQRQLKPWDMMRLVPLTSQSFESYCTDIKIQFNPEPTIITYVGQHIFF